MAALLRRQREDVATRRQSPSRSAANEMLDRMTRGLANICEADNPRFKRGRFYMAAGAAGRGL
jgi:hypothetical protein